MSPHILIDQDLDELSHAGCPEGYEVLVQRNINAFMQTHRITLEEFDHYCKRLNVAIAHRPRSAA
ncbi:hypothetical protein NTD84_03330 [Pseudomonas sp. 14P_8.1_Bac3]|uniref:hypothetical protein n=1 Tax=Pseudomonas sp. 14P_8.1_Bac3 TaxID=2971621 RepID=UPI0021C81810|nr:hypothetical protein [Pseudomonas sp. 14P_8.1_Bac3]MCU1758753.1 hypothetical protein [Pseudomonas sp. 14P_8.1_Bac3]